MDEVLLGGSSAQTDCDSLDQSVVGAETGRCGICMEEVIDRGVLDCCNHWFCFKCIDNWAIITNLCPLCKAQFEIITCLPVHDTISGSNEWNSSAVEGTERDESWCIYGENRALSFPSYYIDEDAIICLDGDGCRIRSGVTTEEESSSLDTSVACDSCDIWYHALCVGFDPQCTNEIMWLCPRCKMSGVLEELNSSFSQSSLEKDQSFKSFDDRLLNRKMSVHVADAGETAVVVSMFEGENCGPATDKMSREAAPLEDEQHKDKMFVTLCNDVKIINSEKLGGDEPVLQLAENDACKGPTIFPSVNDSTSVMVEDCSQILSVAVPNEEINHASLIVSTFEADKHCPATQEKPGEVAPVDDKQNTNKVSLPLSTDVNTNSTELGRDSPFLELAENVVSVGAYMSCTIFPSINDLQSVAVEDCSQIPSIAAANKEINNAVILPRSGLSNSDTELKDRAMPTSLDENSRFSLLTSECQNLVEPSPGKSKNEEGEVVEFGPEIAKSLEKLHAQKGKMLSTDYCLVDLSVSQGQANLSTLSADKDTVKRIHAEGSLSDSEPTESVAKRIRDPKCRDALATMDSMQFGQGLEKITKHREISSKRARLCGQNEQIHLPSPKSQCNDGEITVPKDAFRLQNKLKVEKLENHIKSKVISPDLMEIVKGDASAKTPEHYSSRKTSSENNRVSSVRLKKIMPRRMNENETSHLVQEMKNELRAAVGSGTMEDLGKIDAYDERLLEAFKAAMKKTFKNDNKSNLPHSSVNKQPLKRGKIRENLTKKIYSSGNGKRRRAWDRDCEIEFWKARCNKEKQLKQIETPDSIRDLLKKGLDACSKSFKTENSSKRNEVDPIFSRLYVADNSLFPRKDDIKPLSVLSNSGNLQAGRCDIGVKVEETSEFKTLRSNVVNVARSIHPEKMCLDVDNLTSSLNSGSLQSTVTEQKCGNSGDMKLDRVVEPKSGNSKDVKLDKRKWALEVLARKTGGDQRKNESRLGERGGFPLLTQLPIDMRPILPHDRRSKIPTAVRQMQLNRLVEHYLKSANMEIIRRTAESEFAVADAVNKEQEIYERTNSKSVYINLCAQALSQQVYGHKVVENDDNCHELGGELSDNVTASLKAAGLISDSPPGSPYHITEDSTAEIDITLDNKDDATDCVENVLELDCHPALDLYGDFEYDLEDVEDPAASIISNSLRIPAIKSEDAASKVKVVLSTAQWNKDSLSEQVDGGHVKKMFVEQSATGEPNPLLSRGEFKAEANKNEFLSLDDMHVRSGIEGSEILDTPVDKNLNSVSSADANGDIKTCVLNVDLLQIRQCDHGLGLEGHSADLIDSQDQSSSDKNTLNQINGETISVSCPVKESVGDSQSISDQFSDSGDGFGLGKLPARVIRDTTKRGIPDCENDAAVLKTDKLKGDGEMKQKGSVRGQPRGDGSKTNCEIGGNKRQYDISHSIRKKVEAYIKEHIRPLCKSGVITVEQYRWAVGKTVEKVMKYHCNAKHADFLITEGNKVKKLAEQYLQAFKQKETC